MRRSWWLVLGGVVVLLGYAAVLSGTTIFPMMQEDLTTPRVYAYRDWQSQGILLQKGDWVQVRAQGRWLYTPKEYNGPEGHRRYLAPDFYPLPGVAGGALIGRIGEEGTPFYVGRYVNFRVDQEGMFYLRIDDDILSDNDGYVTVVVTVTPAEETTKGEDQ